MRFRDSLPAFALCLLTAGAVAPLALARGTSTGVQQVADDLQSDAQRIEALARRDSRVMDFLDHLANRIGPRLTGSHGYDDACDWTVEEFERMGLSNVRLEAWGEVAVGFNRGPSSGRMLAPVAKELRFGTNAWTAGTKGRVAGLAVLAPTTAEELEAVRPKLAGAWIVTPPTPARSADRRPPAAADRQFREMRDRAYEDAGILGTIRGARGDLIVTGGNMRIKWDDLPKRPAIQLVGIDHADVVERLKKGEEVRLEFDVRNWFERGPIVQNNVIAEIPGAEKPDEYVIVGGHLDSWDGATGALDNGTGVATAMEAARLLMEAGVKPRRTIRFMLWGGEEQGLLGSRGWIEKNKDQLPRISAVLVHDGGTNYCAGIPATPPMMAAFQTIFAPVKDLDPELPFKVREVKSGISTVGSDSDAFLSAGVPGFFWDQKGRSNYTHVHHTQYDTYEEAIPEYQINSSIVIAVGALGIANLPDLLPRENLRATGGGGGGRRLGVQLDDAMVIEEVVDGGLAAKIGLRVGDRLEKIGETKVADREELRTAMQEAPAKTKVVVVRGSESMAFDVEFPVDLDAPIRRYGFRLSDDLEVERVTTDGVADKAAIKVGDTITAIDGKTVATKAELSAALAAVKDSVMLAVRTGKDAARAVTLTLPSQP